MSNIMYSYEELQKMIVKSLIHQMDFIPEVHKEITSEDFTNEKYKRIYQLLLDFSSSNTKPNTSTIYKELKSRFDITLTSEDFDIFSPNVLEPPSVLAQLLKEESVVFKSKEVLNNAVERLDKESFDIGSILGQVGSEVQDLNLKLLKQDDKTFKEVVDEVIDEVLLEEEDKKYVIPTPYDGLNKYLLNGGLEPNQLVTVGARTGVGKTVLATNITEKACKMGKSVLYFSLEMKKEKLIKRFVASHGNVMLRHLVPQKNRVDSVIERIKQARKDVREWKLTIVDESDVTIEKVKSHANRIAKSKDGLDMIVIDYLQLMSTAGIIAGNRQEQVAQISRQCKILANNYGVPVIILVQLNRESKGEDEDKIPSKADIRESAAIAADSDIILIIHRKYRDDSPDPKAILILDKNRDGAADKKITLRCALEKNIFEDISDREETSEEIKEVIQKEQELSKDEVVEDFGNIQDVASNWEDYTENSEETLEDDLLDFL